MGQIESINKNSELLKPGTLDALGQEYEKAKAQLDRAKKVLDGVEKKIVRIVGNKPEGSQSFKGDVFKITTTGKITRKLDSAKIMEVIQSGSVSIETMKKAVEYKPSLDTKGFKSLKEADPEAFKAIAYAVEEKQAKTSVKIDVLTGN